MTAHTNGDYRYESSERRLDAVEDEQKRLAIDVHTLKAQMGMLDPAALLVFKGLTTQTLETVSGDITTVEAVQKKQGDDMLVIKTKAAIYGAIGGAIGTAVMGIIAGLLLKHFGK